MSVPRVLVTETHDMNTHDLRIGSGKFIYIMIAALSLLIACSKDDTPEGQDNTGGTTPGQVLIRNMSFDPSPLTVVAGTKVTWKNQDGVTHTVTSNTGLFDSGNLGANQSFSYTFSTPGTYEYYCKLHSGMNGTVIVN